RGDGSLIWEQTVAEPRGRSEIERLVDVDADLLLVNPVIIAVSTGGNVRVLRQDNGQVIWERSVGGFVGAALDETCLYLVDKDDVVSCLDPRNGAAIWTNENLRYRRLSGAYAYKGNVLLADYEGYVHALSTASGQIIARERLSSAAIPWLGEGPEGRVLALAANGHLNVFDTQPLSAR
ncbi:MAG: PQQ-binding-like beta-propeller repeat protein, partial [Oceanococcaceae bacterium]